ncbi:MAG: AMP-binding protein [Pseudonocardiaceae bacterium]|nr:AMP-binding protein [Pseudonocardiaceae bacterium]
MPNISSPPAVVARQDSVADILRRSASRHQDRMALIFAERRWSYGELDAAVSRIVTTLLDAGLPPGDRVAAYGKNSDAYALLFLGCARAGLVHVPINYNLIGEELTYLVTQSTSTALFVDPAFSATVDEVAPQLGEVRRGTLRDGDGAELGDVLVWALGDTEPQAPAAPIGGEDLVQLLYTSGTTSAPKGAMMSHQAMVHEYISSAYGLEFSADDVVLHAFPLYHSAQMHALLMPYLMLGATNHIAETFDPGDCLAHPGTALPSCWAWHPAVVEELWWLRNAHHDAYHGRTACWRDVGDWHDRQRPGVTARIRKAIADCELSRHINGGDARSAPVQRRRAARRALDHPPHGFRILVLACCPVRWPATRPARRPRPHRPRRVVGRAG